MGNNIIKINKGSDFEASFNWRDQNGNTIDLTGYTVSLFDADAYTETNMTIIITEAISGLISLNLQWSDSMPLAKESTYFRVKLSQGSYDVTTNKLFFEVI